MTTDYRLKRYENTLKQCVGNILLNEVNNPLLKEVSIMAVSVSPNLKAAKIIVTALKDEKLIMEHLNKAKGFIKRLIARNMFLKYVPQIEFYFGTTFQDNNRENNEIANHEERNSKNP